MKSNLKFALLLIVVIFIFANIQIWYANNTQVVSFIFSSKKIIPIYNPEFDEKKVDILMISTVLPPMPLPIDNTTEITKNNQDITHNLEFEHTIQDMPTNTQNEKQFVYLVETEQCLPEKYIKKESLGDSVECMCDVIVLSFKHKCLSSTLSHVEYIEPQASTWAGGRNIVYNAAISRNRNYLYYIFMDDDMHLYYNTKYAPVEMQSISPWRAFERFLIDHEPVVGATNYQFHHDSEAVIQSFHKICPPHIKPNEKLPSNRTSIGTELPLYLTVVTFDGMFNAYHRDAKRDLLPYTLSYDYLNWNFAQLFQFAKVELMYRGQAVMFTPVNANNPLHRDYPRGLSERDKVFGKVVRDIAQNVPSEYSNEPWIKQFSDNPILYKDSLSLTICYKFPPKHPIRKYSHFSSKWTL